MTLYGNKPALSSKTIQGIIAAGIGYLLTFLNPGEVDTSEITSLVAQGADVLGNVLEWAGLAYAWYGRRVATQRID